MSNHVTKLPRYYIIRPKRLISWQISYKQLKLIKIWPKLYDLCRNMTKNKSPKVVEVILNCEIQSNLHKSIKVLSTFEKNRVSENCFAKNI